MCQTQKSFLRDRMSVFNGYDNNNCENKGDHHHHHRHTLTCAAAASFFSKTKMIFSNKQKVLENVEIFSEETQQGINFSELQSLMTPLCLVSPR